MGRLLRFPAHGEFPTAEDATSLADDTPPGSPETLGAPSVPTGGAVAVVVGMLSWLPNAPGPPSRTLELVSRDVYARALRRERVAWVIAGLTTLAALLAFAALLAAPH